MQLEDILSKNTTMRNTHAGRRCFIIGNGPSLATQDLELLKGEICIVVSSFHRHPLAKAISPAYWVMADPDIWALPEKHFIPTIQHVHNLGIPTRLFMPTGGFPCFANVNTGPFIDLHFFHYDSAAGIDTPIDFTASVPPYGQNVVIVALMLAYFLGCNPIYFLGCDHDFMKITRDEYEGRAVNHFYPEAKPPEPSNRLSWDVWQSSMAAMDFQYSQLGIYASRFGFEVFNATRGGCLEHFPRVEFESLFNHIAVPLSTVELPTEEIFRVTDTAISLIEADDFRSALILLDEAIRRNINRNDKIQGLYYLKAACLAKLRRYDEALILARQDHACNPGNREISSLLIGQLEEVANDCRQVA